LATTTDGDGCLKELRWDAAPDDLPAICRDDESTRPTIDYVCYGCGRRHSGKPGGQPICADCHLDAPELAELLSERWW
jgi:hypothetical protein